MVECMGKNRAMISHWFLMILAAIVCRIVFQYWAGEYQGYLTPPIRQIDYGFAHIKDTTGWVVNRQLFPLPNFLPFVAMFGSLAWLAYEVRKVYKSSIHRK